MARYDSASNDAMAKTYLGQRFATEGLAALLQKKLRRPLVAILAVAIFQSALGTLKH